MASFGEKLKLEREKKKMTLEDISATTKISTRMLHALEEEKFTQLPGGIFNKGFVRAYARTVGLDEDQTIADYLEASGEAPPRVESGIRENGRDNVREIPSRNAPLRITDEPSGRLEIRAEVASRQIPWGILAVILLVIALALSLWTNRRREQERLASHPVRASQQEQPQAPSQAASSTDTATTATPPAESATGSQPPANSSPAPSSPDVRSASVAASDKSPSSPSPPETAPALAPGEFAVTVRAREESWVSISIDGKHTASEVLEAGDERTLRARSDVVVKAGNSGGVDLLLNGKRLSFPGEADVVKTITVGPSGIVPNAAPPSPVQ